MGRFVPYNIRLIR